LATGLPVTYEADSMPSLLTTPGLSLALLIGAGCTAEPQDPRRDRELYLAGLGPGSLELRREACRAIGDEELAGDCWVALVPAVEDEDAAGVRAHCRQLPASPWRDECFFAAAELARAALDYEGAAELCIAAGDFEDDCSVHLWQRELRSVLHPGGMQTLLARHDKAEGVHDRWAARFERREIFTQRFWEHCYQVAFEGAEQLDMTLCEAMPEPERPPCAEAAAQTFRFWLQQSLLQPDNKRILCSPGLDEAEIEALATALGMAPVVEHPRLARVLQDFRTERCAPPRER
jgi:hypothetical protein